MFSIYLALMRIIVLLILLSLGPLIFVGLGFVGIMVMSGVNPGLNPFRETPYSLISELVRSAGTEIVTNIVAIGSLVGRTQVVSEDAAREAILSRIPPSTEKVNQKAFELGLQVSSDMPEV
jgi:hypothetical protein